MIGQRKNTAADIVVVGFALFSMFFGAGNVIFPPFLGMEAGSQWLTGFSAYFIADIGLAMMGMFALLRVGSSEKVLERAGRVPAEILMCAIILYQCCRVPVRQSAWPESFGYLWQVLCRCGHLCCRAEPAPL